jgi:hypothetical protein
MKIHLQRFILLFFLIPLWYRHKPNPIVEKQKHEVLSWFFLFYWEESTGKIWLQIDKLDEEILYQTSLPAVWVRMMWV